MSQNEPVRTGENWVAELRDLDGIWEEKVLWEKKKAAQEVYKGTMRLCREKMRRAKAQLEHVDRLVP